MSDKQISFTGAEFERFGKTTKHAAFLEEMNRIVPWKRLSELVEPHYPKGELGRPPIRLEMMLRIYFLQQWFNLSDPGVEEALYESVSIRRFVGVDLSNDGAPDKTTFCKFRHLLEMARDRQENLRGCQGASQRQRREDRQRYNCRCDDHRCTEFNKERGEGPRSRDASDTQGNQWFFGMKAHIGVDSATKVTHSLETTSANIHDSKMLDALLHGAETRVWGDSAYVGQGDVIRVKAPQALDFTQKRAYCNRPLTEAQGDAKLFKSRTRSRVERVFGIVKCLFGFRKVRYRGLAKNTNCLHVLFALANLTNPEEATPGLGVALSKILLQEPKHQAAPKRRNRERPVALIGARPHAGAAPVSTGQPA